MAIKDQYGPESIALFSGNGVQFKGDSAGVSCVAECAWLAQYV